jgi:hypothetical protein
MSFDSAKSIVARWVVRSSSDCDVGFIFAVSRMRSLDMGQNRFACRKVLIRLEFLWRRTPLNGMRGVDERWTEKLRGGIA